MRSFIPVFALLLAPATAQLSVVPAAYRSSDGPTVGWFPGIPFEMRQQIVIDASHLAGWRGHSVEALWLRRDQAYGGTASGGAVQLDVWLSTSAMLDADSPSARFTANLGPNRQEVFAGQVTVPTSPPGNGDTWGPSNTIRIPFTTPFVYKAGNLCVDCVGSAVDGRAVSFWPVDAVRPGNRGQVQRIGQSCVNVPLAGPQTAFAHPGRLRIGGVAELSSGGRIGTMGLLLIGSRLLGGGTGVSLASVQAPGCTLLVDGLSSAAHAFAPPIEGMVVGRAVARIPIPKAPGLLGANWYVQWAHTEWSLPRSSWSNPAGIVTSNALQLAISAIAPSDGLSTIETRVDGDRGLPPTGVVRVSEAPVLAFRVR